MDIEQESIVFEIVSDMQKDNRKYDIRNKEITPDRLAHKALDFAHGFHKVIDLITDSKNLDQILYCEQIATVLALESEILLKSLLYRSTSENNFKWIVEHDLIKLFVALPEEDRTSIHITFNADEQKHMSYKDFIASIEEIKDTFTQFRYCFELNGFTLKYHFLKTFTQAVYHYSSKIDS